MRHGRCVVIFAVLFLSIASAVSGAVVRVLSGPPTVGDASVGPVVYWEEVYTSPRPYRVNFLRVDLSDPRYEVATIVDPANSPTDATSILRPPMALAQERGVMAAINANAFRYPYNTPDFGSTNWVAGKAVFTFGLVVSDGALISNRQDARIPLWIDGDNKAHVGHPSAADQVKQAIANWEAGTLGWPLQGGAVVAGSSTPYARTMIGTDQTGRWLYMAFVPRLGSTSQYSQGLTIAETANLMLARGSYDAINLDGGGSSTMLIDSDGALAALGNPVNGYLRPLPVMMAVRAVPEPSSLVCLGIAALGMAGRRRGRGEENL